jgi:Tfp pilus assembly protein PilF
MIAAESSSSGPFPKPPKGFRWRCVAHFWHDSRPKNTIDRKEREVAATTRKFKLHRYLVILAIWTGLQISLAPCSAQSVVLPTKQTRAEQATQLVADGVAALEKNDVTAARSYFQQALAAEPGHVMAHTYLGILADRSGDLPEAERHFAVAAATDKSSSAARNNYGAVLLKLGRPKEAAIQFELSLRLNKEQPNALVNLAQIRFAGGTPQDWRAARELFERAYALNPDAEVARALIVIALLLKDPDAAAKYYPEYSTRIRAVSNSINTSASRGELGGALLEARLFKEAVIELTAAVSADPANTEAILRLAKAYLGANDIPAAGRTLESAVARGVNTAPIYVLLASVYEQSGHIENAIPAMRLAIERDSQSEEYRYNYGLLLTRALAPDAAVIRLKEALETFPGSARLWLALGLAHFKAGRNGDAAKALIHTVELDPKIATAHAYLGMTYVETGDSDNALKQYEQALAINPRLGVVNYLVAETLLKQTSPDSQRIETELARAIKLEPSFVPARLALGKLYARNNRFVEAARELEAVIKLDPNLAEAYYQLGRTYTRLKRTVEAQTTLATFKQLSEAQKAQGQKDRKDIVARLANVLF